MGKFRLLFTPLKTAWAIAISLGISVCNYLVCNTSIPLPDEMTILKKWDELKAVSGWKRDSVPDEVMLINVAYDKQLIDYSENEIPLGQTVITDRRKILKFLSFAKKADNYKYIFLDVFFEKGYISEADSELFKTISEMDRIVIPVHEGKELQDNRLYEKAANSDYTVTLDETTFSRFQFIHQGVKSVPLKMYEDITGATISQFGPLYFSNGWFCRNGITLKMPIRISDRNFIDEAKSSYNVYMLGTDVLDMDSVVPVANQINNKIVIIGDFLNDLHDTYTGKQPGSLICLNAYYSLIRGDHSLWGNCGLSFLFYLMMAFLYFILAIFFLNGMSFSSLIHNAWMKVVASVFSVTIIFWIIATIVYISPLGIIYNVWVPSGAFSILDFILSTYNNNKNEKSNITAPAAIVDNSSESSESEDSLAKPSANMD